METPVVLEGSYLRYKNGDGFSSYVNRYSDFKNLNKKSI